MNNRKKITNALSSLLMRINEDAFVIIEDALTKKFVQFTGSASEQLLLDLPSQTLTELEFYNAARLFRKMGVIGDEHAVLDETGGNVVGRQFTFSATFRSVDDAVNAVEDIFADVYEFHSDYEFEIIEN